ncbi:MAG: PspC domain-containing protein [Ignavibacteriaceae bacterium]
MNKKLYRSRKDKMIGGVAGGLGEYFDIDSTLVRIIFVVSLFLGGTGVLAYIILWIVIPEEPWVFNMGQGDEKKDDAANPGSAKSPPNSDYLRALDERRHKRATVAGVILIVFGVIFLADNFVPRIHFSDYFPLILVAIGIGLLINSKRN